MLKQRTRRSILDPIKKALARFDIAITHQSTLQTLIQQAGTQADVELLLALPREQAPRLLDNFRKSKSQFRQDLFVLSELNFKFNGFFVDFGATDGIQSSNSYILEKNFGWSGILAEPARYWHAELHRNRKCHIETCCVWSKSSLTLNFREDEAAELSSIAHSNSTYPQDDSRQNRKSYPVATISLNDLLEKYNAPRQIDYLSIDTEGSELEILSNLDFSKYNFKVITCEHNYTDARVKIHDLLVRKGYKRKLENLSRVDDWYVLEDV
jgi:FkbM family methyltransferase